MLAIRGASPSLHEALRGLFRDDARPVPLGTERRAGLNAVLALVLVAPTVLRRRHLVRSVDTRRPDRQHRGARSLMSRGFAPGPSHSTPAY